VLADTLVAGHPVAGPSDVALASAIALPVVDLLTIGSLAWRGRVHDRPLGAAARAFRKSARQARKARGGRHGVIRAARSTLRALRRPAQFAFLPRPARWALGAMLWPTAFVTAWIVGSAVARGFPPGTWQLRGQQLFAWTWMLHLVIWCQLACRRLNRSRASASMLTPGKRC
jgi:hypothetical protein